MCVECVNRCCRMGELALAGALFQWVLRGGTSCCANVPIGKPSALRRNTTRIVQLRSENWRETEGKQIGAPLIGEASQHFDKWHVCMTPGLVQPLLANRPASVVGNPRQVAMQDEAESAKTHVATAIKSCAPSVCSLIWKSEISRLACNAITDSDH